MKLHTFLAQSLLLAACTALVADGQEKKDLFQQYVEKFGPPGPEHKMLEPLVGTWHANVKMWHDPSQSPHESEGTLMRKAILGGRFIQEEFAGKLMDQPFEGRGTIGYDRAKQKYVTTWMDSMMTTLQLSYGVYDPASKTWTFKAEETCPITGQRVKIRDTLRVVSADEQQLQMFRQMGDEKEMRMMEINLTRKK